MRQNYDHRRVWLWVVGAVLLCGLAVLYSFVDPEQAMFPRCPVKTLTGWDCPGCGSQRAVHDLFHGNILQAWSHNAMLIISIPVLILLFIINLWPTKWPQIHATLNSRTATWTTLTIIILWTIARNLFNNGHFTLAINALTSR